MCRLCPLQESRYHTADIASTTRREAAGADALGAPIDFARFSQRDRDLSLQIDTLKSGTGPMDILIDALKKGESPLMSGHGPGEPHGRVTAVRGSVVEVAFADGLPAINEALRLSAGERMNDRNGAVNGG